MTRRTRRYFWLRLLFNPSFCGGARKATFYQMGYKQALKDVANGKVADMS